jgi:tetratricopeptide (TPR) repeat protein
MITFGTTQATQIIATAFFAWVLLLSHPSKEDYLARGDEHYKACDNERALKEYQLAYTASSLDYNTLLRLVRIHNDMGRIQLRTGSESEKQYRLAVMYADSLLRYYPDSASSQFWYSLAKGSLIPFVGIRDKIRIGKEVKQHLELAIQRESAFSYPYVVKAIFEREGARLSWIEKGIARIIFGEDVSGSLQNSERFLQKALQYDSTNSFAYYELYWTYMAKEDTSKAITALQQILKLPTNNLREQNQQIESKKHLQELLTQ